MTRKRCRKRVSMVAVVATAGACLTVLSVLEACSEGALLQGASYEPERVATSSAGASPPGDASTRCRDGGCDAGADASADAATDASKPPTRSPAPPTNTCATARDLGSISGDTGDPVVSTSGTCSEWLKVRVTENDNGVIGTRMRLSVTLEPPSGRDVDLFAYLDPNADTVSCTSPIAVSEIGGPGASESLAISWGENAVGNGSDDTRTLSILVVVHESSCEGVAPWSLEVDGHR